MEKTCPECGFPVVGRRDKVFCSDACRNAFNNRKSFTRRADLRRTNDRLSHNYRILKTLADEDIVSVSSGTLREIGFDIALHTSSGRMGLLWQEFRCYSFSYRLNRLTGRMTRLRRTANL